MLSTGLPKVQEYRSAQKARAQMVQRLKPRYECALRCMFLQAPHADGKARVKVMESSNVKKPTGDASLLAPDDARRSNGIEAQVRTSSQTVHFIFASHAVSKVPDDLQRDGNVGEALDQRAVGSGAMTGKKVRAVSSSCVMISQSYSAGPGDSQSERQPILPVFWYHHTHAAIGAVRQDVNSSISLLELIFTLQHIR